MSRYVLFDGERISLAPYLSAAVAESLFHCCAMVVVLLGSERLHLIAADVKIGSGRQRADLAHHVIEERVCLFLVDADRAPADVSTGVEG
jgi:hypothetical protein